MKPTYEQLEQQLAAVVAENAHARQRHMFIRALAVSILEHSGGHMDWRGAMEDAKDLISTVDAVYAETPVTDAYLAEVRAQAIRNALDSSSDYLDTDCVMDRLDISYKDAELRTSGAIELHDALVAVANELRQGAA